MPAIDFKEIPLANSGAQRDQFELFAQEFLHFLHFRIIVGPDRGPDAGRDLVVEEVRTGIVGETRQRWLVSCKHKAHSGNSVTLEDEPDIHDRVRTHRCQGFLAFYSTIPSSGLATKLNAHGLPCEIQIFGPEHIERYLLRTPEGVELAKRFFPNSIARWKSENPAPARIFAQPPELSCHYCGKNLLEPELHGIMVEWRTIGDGSKDDREHIEHFYWCCKGGCDRALKVQHRRKEIVDLWEDLSDLVIPIVYVRFVMAMLNQMQDGVTYSNNAFAKSKQLLLSLYPLVARDMTDDQKTRVTELSQIPDYLGGLEYGN